MKVSTMNWTSHVTTRIQARLGANEVDLTVATPDGSPAALLAEAELMARKAARLLRNAELIRQAVAQATAPAA